MSARDMFVDSDPVRYEDLASLQILLPERDEE